MKKEKKPKEQKEKKPKRIEKKDSFEKALIENSIALQRVIANLSSKLNDLSNRISKLLELFEISARTLAERKPFENKELGEKMDRLLEQNKTLAKGLALMHERIPLSSSSKQEIERTREEPEDLTGYQKSIQLGEESEEPEFKKPKFKPLPK